MNLIQKRILKIFFIFLIGFLIYSTPFTVKKEDFSNSALKSKRSLSSENLDNINCEELYKKKGFLCIGSIGQGQWKNIKFTYKISSYGNGKIVLNVKNNSSTNYKKRAFYFGFYDKDFELLSEERSYFPIKANSEIQEIIQLQGYVGDASNNIKLVEYSKYIKFHNIDRW